MDGSRSEVNFEISSGIFKRRLIALESYRLKISVNVVFAFAENAKARKRLILYFQIRSRRYEIGVRKRARSNLELRYTGCIHLI